MCLIVFVCAFVLIFLVFMCVRVYLLEMPHNQTLFVFYTFTLRLPTATFDHVYDGKDVMAKAKTGTGKTLSFALPLIEILSKAPSSVRGRSPRVLVMAPTRELARQVCADFEIVGTKVSSLSVYGGVPYDSQGEW